MLTRTGRRRLPVLLILIVALSLFLAGAPARAQEGSAPDKPTGLTVASVSHDSVELDWDDSGDSSITHYQVFRRDRAVHDAGEFVIIEEDTGSTATEYTDATVEADEEYVYRVKAVNAHGASPWSDHVRADTPTGPGQETVYTYEDGDRTIRVILQGDLVVQETGADTPSDDVVRRTAGGNIVRKQSGQGGADLPVFRSASGGALMTLPGGVLLALDPEWDRAAVNGFFARNNIWKGRVSELDYIPNGFFVRTEPGFPSLELANALAAQKGVVLSSPNWWREVEAKQDPEETKGDDQEGTQKAGGIEPRNASFDEAYTLPLDGMYEAFINPASDVDYFKLDLTGESDATEVRIYTTGEAYTLGELYDSDRESLMEDQKLTGNLSLLASLSPAVYYVTVRGPGSLFSAITIAGNYTLHAETVTATSVSLGSSVAASITAAGEVDYFKLDLSDQTGPTDVSLFTVSDDLVPLIEAPSGSLEAMQNVDALGDRKRVVHWSADNLSSEVHLLGVRSHDGDTGDYTLRVAAVPDHGSTTATATDLSLGAPTSGKLTSATDADYFELELTETTNLAIMAFSNVNPVMFDSGTTEIPVNVEIGAGGFNRIIDDFASGTYYVKMASTAHIDTTHTDDGTLVSNTSQGSATTVHMRTSNYAQAFTTGANAAGYVLSSVKVVSRDAAGDGFTVALYTVDDDGYPDALHALLTAPDSFAAGTLVFTAYTDTILEPNTTYALVFDVLSSPADVGITISNDEDSEAAAGWSIANTYYLRRSTGWEPPSTSLALTASIRIAIEGAAAPVSYALYAYEDTGYGPWVDGCADATNDLGISTINDPLYACQWHLNSDDSDDMDINVESVWADSITGAGVNVAVVDSTMDYSHADLSANINSALNHDYGDRSNAYRPAEHHGTNVAGVIAALDNAIGVRGVAPRATIYGYNLLADGEIYATDMNEADAMLRNRVATAVSNNSWGPVDGYAFDHAPEVWEMAIDKGVKEGYGGKGVFYAWAGGNGGKPGVGFRSGDNSNFDEYANYYGVTAVCAVGDDGIRAAYSEKGANLWVCAPSSGGDRGIVTTENSDRYINDFNGTSSATPKVAGVAALLRHANPDLTWRDLKLILAASARQNDASNAGWDRGARKYGSTDDSDRYHFNHEYGFGVVDAAAAVALARDWRNLPEFKNASSASRTLNRTIPDNTASGITSSLSLDTEIDFTEFVEVTVTIDHPFWRDLRIELVSPAGSVSTLAVPAVFIDIPVRPPESTVSPGTFRFGSAKHLGENPNGTWTLRVSDELPSDQGALTSWSIKVYGHQGVATGTTLVSNTGQAGFAYVGVGNSYDRAQAFTTGANAAGYALSSAEVVSVDRAGDGFTAAVYTTDGNDRPATLHAALAAPRSFAAGTLVFTAPANTTLQPSTTYALVFEDLGREASLAATTADGEDSGPAAGWRIANAYHYRQRTGSWQVTSTGRSIHIAIEGTAQEPAPDLVVGTPTVSDNRPVAGASFTLNATVGNRGSAAAGSTTLSYYRSDDRTIDTSDTAVGTDSVSGLSAGEDSEKSTSVTAPTTAGTHYYGACVDAVTNESDTTNNCSTAVRVAVTAPDLVVGRPTAIDSDLPAGATFTLSATVHNRGSAASTLTQLRYYRSDDRTIDTSDTAVGTDSAVGALGSGTSSAHSTSVIAPSTAGTYYYGACVDAVTNESITTNNCSTARAVFVRAPDLMISSRWVSDDSLTAGATFTLSATVRNQGLAAAGSTTLRYYRSGDLTIDTTDTQVGTADVDALGWGTSSNHSTSVIAPSTAGTYNYGACVDAVPSESNTENNCSAVVRVTVVAAPDLVVDPPTVSDDSPTAGAPFTLSVTVRNKGSAASGRSTLRYYRSNDDAIDTSDTSVGTDRVSGLAAAATSAEFIDLIAPSAAGTYYYGACVSTVTNESDGTNNCSAVVRVTVVAAPDLVVGTPTVSDDSPTAGASFTLRATVSNEGGGAADSTTLTYYRSTNTTIDTNDSSVGTATVSSLSAGASSAQSTSVTAPSTAGTYYYGACVDAVANESNTTNNCSVAVEVTVLQANAAPVFRSSSAFDAAENQTSAGRVQATDSDTDDSVTGYAITDGADQAFFSIGATSGALTFDAAPNYEDAQDQGAGNSYVVVVRATSGTGTRLKTATQTITVTVTDVDTEAPGKPGTPRVSAASASSLRVIWSAPSNAGPPITRYDVQYRTSSPGGSWTEVTVPSIAAMIENLSESTSYQVRVRATNAEGAGPWSDSGSGTTDANAAPLFSSPSTFSVAENRTTVGTVRATDADAGDNITGYAITDGADRRFFSIGATSGALTFDAAPNYEDAQDQGAGNSYVVVVRATSGTGTRVKTATQTITVTVTDVSGEAPGRPGAPSVSAASATSLSVNWAAPDNEGPVITDYDVQYRAGTSGDWSDGGHNGTAPTATLRGLSENTSYQVQVRATNAEGTGPWSTSGSGTTDANAAPVFRSSSAFDAVENRTSVDTVLATDSDTGDDVTGYAITGGADRRFFSIGATSGALTFDAAPNYEAAQDQGANNTYVVVVRATSGTGTRVKTATQTITVTVTDVNTEAPGRPAAPSVTAASATSLSVNWAAPDNEGPVITDYDVQYRAGTSGSFSPWSHNGTATATTLTALSEDTSYQVRVRAKNDEGTGSWSTSGSGTTDANAAPVFTSSATFSVAENQTRVGTVQATDADAGDNITGYAITGGEDQSFFSIGVTSGVLTFETAPNYEDAQDQNGDNTYMVEVTATSGTGTREKTATQTITVTVTMAAAPDLVVDEPRVTDSSPLTGASFTLSATVRNRGSAAAGNTILRYYRSTDSTISSSDTPAGTDPVPSLRAGNTSDESTGVTAPSTAGTYYYYACVDALTNESNTENNCSAMVRVTVVAPPDLVVESPSVNNNNPAAAADLTLSATVRNAGGSTAAATTLTYYRSTDSTISSIDTPEGTVTVSSLSAEATSAQFITVTAPSAAGTYYYGACVGAVMDESDTPNNCSVAVAVTVGAAPAPDLVVESPWVTDSSPLTGAPFALWVTVRNQGSAAADNSTLRYRRSIDPTISPDDTLELSRSAVIGLRPGGTVTQQMPLDAPFTAGTYYYYACVEAVLDESNTENNCSAVVRVTVGAAPVFSEGDSTERSVAENSAAGANVGSAVRATDADNDTLTYSLEGTDEASFSIVSARGQIRTVAALDHETRSSYSVRVKADDGKGGTATIEVIITVTDVNEPPTVNGENLVTIFENEDLIASYSAIDPEGPATTFTWSVTGTDRGDFNINRNTGDLTFRNTPDFERPADSNRDSVYEVTVRAYDGRYYGSFDVTVTVEDVNEPPTITTTSSSATMLRQNENVTSRLYTYRATDPEGADTVTWSVEGVDARFFDIDEKGQFSFKEENPPDFEAPADTGGDNVYNVVVQATDSDGEQASLPVTVTVTGVNEGPEVTTGKSSFTIAENQDLPNAVYTGFDPEGGTVTRWTVGGTDGGDFTISQEGVLTFRNTPDFERPADSDRNNVYQLQVRPYDGRYYGSFDVTVTVEDVNEPPTIPTTSSSATALRQNENVTSRLYTYRATDPEGADTVTWSVGGVDADFFTIDDKGQFSFKEENPPDFEAPADTGGDNVYNVVVQATDSDGEQASLPVTVTVTGVNEGPEVTTGKSSFTIAENQDLPNAVYTGFDPEGGTVTRWTVGGTDGGDFTISQEGVLTFRNTPDFERPADSDRNNVYQLQVRPYDGRYYGSFDVTVTVEDVNEPPTITTTSSSATALRQNENVTSRLYTYRATDPEGADTVTWSVGGVDADFFTIDDKGQFSFKEENPPDFEDPADSGRDNVYNVVVQATDSDGEQASLPVTVTVTGVNEGPEVTTGKSSFTIAENQDLPNAVYTGFDPEGGTVTRWTVGGTDGGDFTISQEGVLTFRNIPDFERPVDSNRDNVYQLQVRPYDGRYYGSFDVTVTVNDVNEPPTITTTSSSATALRQNENVTSRLYTYRATDPEGTDTVTWSVRGVDADFFTIDDKGQFSFKGANPPDFEQPADSGGNNVYNVVVQAMDDGNNPATLPVTVTVANDAEGVEPTITTRRPPATYRENDTRTVYTFRASDPQRGATITWTLEGTDWEDFTITADSSGRGMLAFISPPDYENAADSDGQNDYELTVIATDEDDNVDRLSFTITVIAVDEGPEISGPSSFEIDENGSLPNAVYTAADPEGSNVARWSVGGRDGGDFFITQGGTLYFRSPPDYERPADSDRDNEYEVTIQPSDGRNNGAYPVTVTVNDVDEPPEFRKGSKDSFSYRENGAAALYTYQATDPEGADVTWSVSGADAGRFDIGGETGVLTFREPPDHDDPADDGRNNEYQVTVVATDQTGHPASLPVTVTVTEVNEGPVISRQGSPPGSVPENTPVTQVLATYTATDPERPGVKITQWTTTGRDGGDFVINALGQLMFRNPPDYERPADSNRDNVYEVEIRASDGRNTGTLEEVQRVTVTDVDEAPIITTTSRTAFTLQENRTSTLYTFRATDPEGGTVIWTPAGPDGSHFAIDEGGALSFANPPDYEEPADSGRDNVYEVTIRASDGRNTGTLEVTVTVTDHNEGVEPTISTRRPPATYRENGTSAVYTFRATDPQRGATITWTVEGTDRGDFTITADSSGRGVLAFRNSPDFESPEDADRNNEYELAVVATDDDGNTDRVDFAIAVTDHNEGVEPTISTRRPPSTYRENDTRTVYTFRATDPQRGAITWRLEGTDREDFTITPDSSGRGVLAFDSPPDFESPKDEDRDSIYELAVVATDDDGNTDRLDFAIAVTDVNEGPVITLEGTETTTVSENTPETKVLADYTATDPDNPQAAIDRWSTAGRDGGDFVISDLGELRFRSSPDYERPADSDRNNVYEVTVRAYDGRVYGAHDVTVTVTQMNEAPVITTKSRTEFTLRENFTAVLYTYRATDQDEDDAVTWSVEGADGGDFAIYKGILNFRLLPDLENPVDADEDNVYEITVVAADRAGLRDTVDAVITITDQSEGPMIAGKTSHTVAENYDIAQVLGSYTATDAKDNRPVHPRWSLSGRDGGDFTINEAGELTFRNIPDYDRPADANRDNVYEVTVRGHDSRAYGNLNVTVTVTAVNEHAPVVTGRETLSFRENTAVETRLHIYRATDGDRDTSFTWSLEGDDEDDFAIDQGGVLTFKAPPDYEGPADKDDDNVYRVTVVASDGAKRGTLDVTVTVTEQNEGPVVSGTPEFTVVENQHLPRSAIYTAQDPEAVGGVATTIRWSVSGRDGGDFTIHRDTGLLTFRTPPDHERPADADRNNVYEVTVRAHDGRNYGNFQVTVTVEDVAEITGPAAVTRTENFKGDLATYSPAGQGDLAVEPSWRLTGADSGDFTIDRESGELTFRSIPDHERPADSNRDNVYNFTVQVSDGSYHGTLDVTVTVDAVNEPPVVTGRDSLSFRENTPITTRLHTYRATDPERAKVTWSVTGDDDDHFKIGSETGVLTFREPPDFDIPSGSGTHGNEYLVTVVATDGTKQGTLAVIVTVTDVNEGPVIEVSGTNTAIKAEENTATDEVLATYTATDPENAGATIRWSLSGRDGGDFLINPTGELTFRNTPDYDRPADSNRDNEYEVTVRAYDGRTYGNLDVTITVSNVNEHGPVIRSGSRTSFTYREEGTAALYTYRATDGDKDDVIRWTTEGTDGGDFTIDGDTGELTFREPPDYEHPEDSGGDNVYELTVVATDSDGRSASLDVTVTVTAVDEGPEITGATPHTVSEGQDLTGAIFTAQDPEDADAAVTSWRLAGSDAGDFTITGAGGNSARLTFRNTPDYDRPADSNRDNEYLVTIRAYNGSTYGSLDVTVKVTDENEAEPVVTGRDTLSFRENTATTTRLHTYRATDTDLDTKITWSVEGADVDDFAIAEGVLTFRASPDYEDPTDANTNNVYEITVVAWDSTKRGTLDVTVTDVNEGPVIDATSTNTAITAEENTATDEVLATYTATDPENAGATIRWSVTGRDGGDFTIDRDTGKLTFRNTPDHERPADSGGDNLYEVTVRASDGRVYGAHDVTVTVTPVDEAPEFQRNTQDSFSYRENGTAALYTYRATDPEEAEVTWSVRGADASHFEISRETGVLTFREPPDHDDPADDGNNNEYRVTVVATDQTNNPASLPVTVTVTDVNEGPVIADTGTNTDITVQENHDEFLDTYTATDPEDQPVTRWSVTGRDGGDFTINDGGELTFRNPPDHERPADSNRDSVYEVTVRAFDGRYYGTLDVVVTVEAVDEAPEFQRNTQDSFVYPENGASAIYTYRATDPEGSAVAWGLSGTDSGAFSIDKTGVLTFKSPPDYEAPADSDGDNVYEVVVVASDDSNTNPLGVTVTVTNLTDARAVIRGTAQVGRTLTAETSGIPDKDRSDRVDFSYQWLADETDVEGATDPTYEITERDEGKTIKVRVTFTDNAGREETLTSAATAPVKPAQSNEPATGLPAINGTAQVGETLTADTSGVADADGLSNVQYEYQWLADDSDIAGATNATYTLTDSEESKAITVQVRFTDDADNEETLTSTATDAVAARPAQLTATFPASPFQSSRHKGDDDRPQVIVAFNLPVQSFDETTPSVSLTGATVSSLVRHEEDGLENAWVFFLDPEGNDVVVFTLVAGQSCDGGGICTGEGKMLSEGGTTTLPGPDEEDKPDNTDSNEPNSPATGAPTITGTAQVGETLEAGTSGITDADGLSDVQYEYQWLADGTDISGATNATYTLAAADEGKAIKVQVSFTDDAGNEETLTSAATDVVEAAPTTNSPATGAPTISGTAQVGETLTANTSGVADVDGLSNVQYEYQWLADDSDISGATNATYTLTDSEESKAITVQVSFTDDADNDETLTSAATDAVAGAQPTEPPDQPSGLSATASHDSVTLTWDDPGDDSITGYVILRRIPGVDPEGQFDELVADTGTAATTYTDDTVSAETRYTYRIKAINEHGTSERSRWFHIDTPAAPAPEEEQADEPPAKATGLSSEVSHNMVILTWDDPNDDSITGYLILRRDKDIHEEGTFLTVAPDTGSSETTYIDASVEPERRYVYRIKAINASGVSEISSWVRAYTPAVPDPAPEAPAKPTSLSATFSHDSVTLTWDDPGDDSITGYVILRRDKDLQPEEGTFFTVTSDTGFAETTYTDDTAEPDKRYVYRIKAINEHGEMSEISSWVRAYTPAAP